MKKKKLILTTVFFIIITFVFYSLYTNLNVSKIDQLKTFQEKQETDNIIAKKLKEIIPQNIKNYIKDTIFVFKKVNNLEQQLDSKNDIILNVLNDPNPFKFKNIIIEKKYLNNIELRLTRYTSPLLKLTGPRAYLEHTNENLFLITGTGILIFTNLNNFNGKDINFKNINTNLADIMGIDYLKKHRGVVKGFLIKNKKVYVSYEMKKYESCFTNSVLEADLNLQNLVFNEFFTINECQPKYLNQVGGYLSNYTKDKIFMTTGDYGFYENSVEGDNHPQNKNSLYGKIISLNVKNKDLEIISMGHRNPQGLYYDSENNNIYSTEHGPQGGDEININLNPGDEIENFGWGISSYGEHYGFPDADNSKKYDKAPLYKSHSDYGFIEPLKYFTPSIAPTQIIKTEKFIKANKNESIIYVGSMGYPEDIDEGDMSIHQFILDEKLGIKDHNILILNERIRDMFYLEKYNSIYIFLETSGSIGVLETVN